MTQGETEKQFFFSRITNKSCLCFFKGLRHCFQTCPNCHYCAARRIQVVFGSSNCSVCSRSNLAKSLHQNVYFLLPSLQTQTCTGLPWLQGNPSPLTACPSTLPRLLPKLCLDCLKNRKEEMKVLTGVTSDLNPHTGSPTKHPR